MKAAALLLLAALSASSWAADEPDAGALEARCRERYENGSPKEIRAACYDCVDKFPADQTCLLALEYLLRRPKLPLTSDGGPISEPAAPPRGRKISTEAKQQSQQHYLSGMIYFQKQDYKKARREWKLAVKIDPGNADAAFAISRLDKVEREDKVQEQDVPAASSDQKNQSQQHYLSGMIYFQKADYEKARDEWLLARKLDLNNSDAQAGLDRIEKLQGGK